MLTRRIIPPNLGPTLYSCTSASSSFSLFRFNQWLSTGSKPGIGGWRKDLAEEHMSKRQPQSSPTWTDVKAKLAAFDRAALLDLIHNLYAAHKDNQLFLHARFGLEKKVLRENLADTAILAGWAF